VSSESEERVPATRWLRKWLREEKFWQDITTRTLSALIVVLLGYLYAVLAGYVGAPNMWRLGLSAVVVAMLAAFVIVYIIAMADEWKTSRFGLGRKYVLVSAPVVAIWVFGLYWLARGLFQLLWEIPLH
jgi:hypothetical protein